MSTRTLFPDAGPTIAEGFAQLGTDGIDTLRLTPGRYGESQGVLHILSSKDAPDGNHYDIEFEDGATIDLGAKTWADMYLPNGYGRTVWLGQGYRLIGPGVIENGGVRMLRSTGRFFMDGPTVRCFAGVGLLAPVEAGAVEVQNAVFEDIGIDPVVGDPVWEIVGRVPVGTVLKAGNITFDIHAAVARVGLTDRIVYAEHPDIEDGSVWKIEGLILYHVAKQLGTSGDGLKALYISDGSGHRIAGNTIRRVSGQAVHVRSTADTLIADNTVDYCHSLYHSNHGVTGLRVERNHVTLRRLDNGPRRAKGYAQHSAEAPVHRDNVWVYHQGPEVTAHSVPDGSLPPDAEGEQVYSSDGQPVPIDGGGFVPAEPIPEPPPAERPVVELWADGRGFAELDGYRDVPVEARFMELFERQILMPFFKDVLVTGVNFEGVESERADGQAALVFSMCEKVTLVHPMFEDCSQAGLYVGMPNRDDPLCEVEIIGLAAWALGWNAVNMHRCTGLVRDTHISSTNTGSETGGWDTGAVKITRCEEMLFENYDSHNNNGSDLWIDHGNKDITVRNASLDRLLVEKSIRTHIKGTTIKAGMEEPNAVELRAAPYTTFENCLIGSEGQEKFVLAGNVPEDVDGEEYLTTHTRFVDTLIRGPKFTGLDPFNFRVSGDRQVAMDAFYSTLDDEGLTWEPDGEPVEPPVPPVEPPEPEPCECATKEDIARLEAILARMEENQAALSAGQVDIRERQDRALVPAG